MKRNMSLLTHTDSNHPEVCFLTVVCFLTFPGPQQRHRSSHRSLHVASPLVHVGGHFCHAASHRSLPNPVRVEQPFWHDAPWQEQIACVLIFLRPKPLLCHTVWAHRCHKGKLALLCVFNQHYSLSCQKSCLSGMSW